MLNRLKKSTAVFIAALLIMSCVPVVAFAATTLNNSNVEIVVPTVTPNEITYGQNLGEVTVSGGEMWYNGTQIPGYFTVSSTTIVPAASDAYEVMFKFVPTDLEYTCRSTFRKANTTYTGTWPTIKVTSVGVANLSEAPIASSVVGGSSLDASALSGGIIVDENGNDITSSGTWKWDDNSQIVTENSTYKATWTAEKNAYNSVTADVNVAVAYNVITQSTLSSLSYEYFKDFSSDDLEIIPGVVKAADGVADISGTYEFEKIYKFGVGTFNVNIIFIPDDLSLPTYKTSFAIEITKGNIIFSDDEGNENIPELTMPYGTKLDSNFATSLAKYVNIGENVWIYYRDIDGNEYDYSGTTPGLGTQTYKVTAVPYNPSTSNYKTTELEFKLTIVPLEVTPKFSVYGNDEYEITTGDHTKKPRGTYDLYVNDELVMEDINYQERFTWRPEKSGTYNLKAVYNPVENDTFKVNDAVREMELNLTWKINCINCGAYDYKYGETATVKHTLGNQFGGWKFYDENGNEFTPENVIADESTSSVKFTMPDFAITVEAVDKSASSDSDGLLGDTDLGGLGECSIFANLIAKIKQFFNAIIVFLTAAFAF